MAHGSTTAGLLLCGGTLLFAHGSTATGTGGTTAVLGHFVGTHGKAATGTGSIATVFDQVVRNNFGI